jgi:hypothetical protein
VRTRLISSDQVVRLLLRRRSSTPPTTRATTIAATSSHHQGLVEVDVLAGAGAPAAGVGSGDRCSSPATTPDRNSHHPGPFDVELAGGDAVAVGAVAGVAVGASVGAGVAVGASVGAGVAVGASVGAGVAVGASVGAGVAVGASVGAGVAVGSGRAEIVGAGIVRSGRPAPGLPDGTGSDSVGRGLVPLVGGDVRPQPLRHSTPSAAAAVRSA